MQQSYRNLLDFYKDKDIKSFLYFSTSEIYGDPHQIRFQLKNLTAGMYRA